MSIQLTAGRLTDLLERYRARVLELDQVALTRSGSPAPTTLPLADDWSESPTVRELEVLDLVADGFSNLEVANRLFVAEETVKSHVTNIRRKLSARNRAHAVAIGFQRGLLPVAQAA